MLKLAYSTLLAALVLLASQISGCGLVKEEPQDPIDQIVAEETSALDTDDAECRGRCARLAHEAYRQCKARGGSDERCRMHAREVLRQCLERCRPSCQQRCREMARRAFEQCKQRGGTDEQCRMYARGILERCLRRCERPDGGPPPRPDGGRRNMSLDELAAEE